MLRKNLLLQLSLAALARFVLLSGRGTVSAASVGLFGFTVGFRRPFCDTQYGVV